LLVALFLLATEHEPMHLRQVTRLLYNQLPDEWALKFGTRPLHTEREWQAAYARVGRLWRALIAEIDPSPLPKNRVLKVAESAAMTKALDAATITARENRLLAAISRIIAASLTALPPQQAATWHGSVSVDATPVPTHARGFPDNFPYKSADPDAGLYVRERDSRDSDPATDNPPDNDPSTTSNTAGKRSKTSKPVKSLWGYEATIVTMATEDPDGLITYPNLALGATLHKPGVQPGPNAINVLRAIRRQGHPAGWLAGDRAYTNEQPEKFQAQARRLGYSPVLDLRKDMMGLKESYGGAIQVDGNWYCPAMPEHLINATLDYQKGLIDKATRDARIEARRPYLLLVKERLPDGSVRRKCPALGTSATTSPQISCPISLTPKRPAKPGAVQVRITDQAKVGGAICTSGSITFPLEVGAKYGQELQYGSPEHRRRYATLRNTIEGYNGTVKDPARGALEESRRRRCRGIAAQSVLTAFILAAENLERIKSFNQKAVTINGVTFLPRRNRAARRTSRRELLAELDKTAQPSTPPRNKRKK
jgi:hypothetical protein